MSAPTPAFAVAVSGGRDSMALLHASVHAADALGLHVLALHVHHGLQSAADEWLALVEAASKRWGAGFAVTPLDTRPVAGDSIEAWARRERYQALASMARAGGVGLVLLAHHRRDQAETFLLQALRGAGPAGLAAMPRQVTRDGITWARPWLDWPREAIEAYVRRHRIRHVDDASNDDARFDRNRLRAQVMPGFVTAFPSAEAALAEASRRAAEAQALLGEIARDDLAAVSSDDALNVPAWAVLSEARRRNVLAAWLRLQARQGAPASLLDRLMRELGAGKSPATWPAGDATLRRYRGALRYEAPAGKTPAVGEPQRVTILKPGTYAFAHGTLDARRVREGGIALTRLQACEWRPRAGGERFQQHRAGPPRSLKKQFQAGGVPAWQREASLLFDAEGRLLFVPGLGIDARALAAPGEPQFALGWRRKPAI